MRQPGLSGSHLAAGSARGTSAHNGAGAAAGSGAWAPGPGAQAGLALALLPHE